MAFGQIPPLDHVKFIPVYVMGSTFLTAAWPSLFRSIGLPPQTLDDMVISHDYMPVPMSEVHVDDEANHDTAVDVASTRISSDWLQGGERHSSSPLSFLEPISSEPEDSQPLLEPASFPATCPEVFHMGPSSTYSGGTSHTGTSLSLNPQGGCPSEMSSNVVSHYFQGFTTDPRIGMTQRRSDIEALGRRFYGRGGALNRSRERAHDRTSHIDTVLRKSQSM